MRQFVFIFFIWLSFPAKVSFAQPEEIRKQQLPVKFNVKNKSLQTVTYLSIVDSLLPIKTIQLIFHIVQNKDGNGNLTIENVEHNKFIVMIMNHLNYMYSDLKPMTLPTTSPLIKDSRVRFYLDFTKGVLYHKDSTLFELKGSNPQYTGGEALYKKYVLDKDSTLSYKNSVHIFWCGRGGAYASGIGDGRYVIMSKLLEDFHLEKRHWWVAGWLAHELGHNLGLNHTFSNDGCDDTPLHNDCYDGKVCSNNMMDYNSDLSALIECQLQKIHFNLMKFNPQANIFRAVISDIN